jgi:hypothetical protein
VINVSLRLVVKSEINCLSSLGSYLADLRINRSATNYLYSATSTHFSFVPTTLNPNQILTRSHLQVKCIHRAVSTISCRFTCKRQFNLANSASLSSYP